MSAEQEQPRCLLCGQPAGLGSGGKFLAGFRGDTLDLLGHLCAACGDRLERESEARSNALDPERAGGGVE